MRKINKTITLYKFNELPLEVQKIREGYFIDAYICHLFINYTYEELKLKGYKIDINYIENTPAFANCAFYEWNKYHIDCAITNDLYDYEYYENGEVYYEKNK